VTKPRIPHTWHDAVARIVGRLTAEVAAEAVGKSAGLVREWSDPARGKLPSLDQALALSAAYAAAGGDDAPFVDAFAFQLDLSIAGVDPCRRALAAEIGALASELGDTIASALRLTDPTASPRDVHRASAEAQQCDAALDRLQRRIATFFPIGAGPVAGKTGDHL
jgi:hypothetical protein